MEIGSGSYANKDKETSKYKREYFAESLRGLEKEAQEIKKINFSVSDYRDISIPDSSLVYCDPPYQNTTNGYKNKFNSLAYWDWIREISRERTFVLCSEYNAPDDFIEIFNKETTTTASGSHKNGSSKKSTEKLFIYSKSYYKDEILNFMKEVNLYGK